MSAMAIAAAVLFGVAGALATSPSPLTRLRESAKRRELPAWVRGQPDAVPLRPRLIGGVLFAGLSGFLLGLPLVAIIFIAVVGGVVLAVLVGTIERPAAKRRLARLHADLPQACDLLAACLEAGLPLRSATTVVGRAMGGPIGEEFDRISTQTALGISDEDSWRSVTSPPLQRLGIELARSSKAGTLSSHSLRLQSADATDKASSLRQERARKVGVQAVLPLMVCFLPAFLLLGIVPIVGGFIAPFFG